MTNPYDPQNPVKPNFFGGRRHILDAVAERIEKAKTQKQSGGILVYGYRGVGKTSLLTKIRSIISPDPSKPSSNTISIYRRLGKTTSDSEFYHIITEDLYEEIQQRKTVVQKLKSVPDMINSAKIMDIEFVRDANWSEKTPYHRWRSLVRNIQNADFILIAIDDADYLSAEALGELKTVVEEHNNTPVVLVVSGGFEFEERLVADYSPIARIFSGASFNLGEFKPEETKEVLQNPLVGSNTRWSEDGMREVQKFSGGYPYLVQCIASAAFREDSTIDRPMVKASINAALDIGKGWLSHELSTASDIDIQSFLKIARSDKTTLQSKELSNIGIAPPYIGRLSQLGVLKKISRGRYTLMKPPIIAYYHAIKRGIKIENQ
ncbi:MAG: ATP-binding protein [Candidatus ainarchaeum sp.]|nr:ATP-binding protein [Candidatus ainarchaeum sp.]